MPSNYDRLTYEDLICLSDAAPRKLLREFDLRILGGSG
jgi:hypothetical protein